MKTKNFLANYTDRLAKNYAKAIDDEAEKLGLFKEENIGKEFEIFGVRLVVTKASLKNDNMKTKKPIERFIEKKVEKLVENIECPHSHCGDSCCIDDYDHTDTSLKMEITKGVVKLLEEQNKLWEECLLSCTSLKADTTYCCIDVDLAREKGLIK